MPADRISRRRLLRVAGASGVLILLASGAACAGGRTAGPIVRTSTSPSPASSPSAAASTSPPTTAPPRTTRPPTTAPPPAGVLAFSEFYPSRRSRIGTTVAVRGRVLFVLRCPPPASGTAPPCIAVAYLADPGTTDLPPSGDGGVPLFRDGRGIGCAAHTTHDLSCGGLHHNTVRVITATVLDNHGQVVLEVIHPRD
ncbi:MAG: hypothetical protein ACRDT6_16995 [Micromonosporaceae bacterium]